MAKSCQTEPSLLVSALFSRHLDALLIGRTELERHFGPVALSSLIYDFNQTAYYQGEMGPGLRKHFLAFNSLIKPDCLPDAKLLAIDIEHSCAESGRFPEQRPLNIDPGLLTLGKFMLATTKDQAHRVYLREGIFCEITLRFAHGSYVPWPWTYADYRQPCVLEFMKQARTFYRQRLAAQGHLPDAAGRKATGQSKRGLRRDCAF
jgi:hypothetical protein